MPLNSWHCFILCIVLRISRKCLIVRPLAATLNTWICLSADQCVSETNIAFQHHDNSGSTLEVNLTHEHQILDGGRKNIWTHCIMYF
jgi:hypothetical protein